jgi:hypothetical protein
VEDRDDTQDLQSSDDIGEYTEQQIEEHLQGLRHCHTGRHLDSLLIIRQLQGEHIIARAGSPDWHGFDLSGPDWDD